MNIQVIERAVDESGLRRDYIAKQLGISKSAMSQALKGNRKLSIEEFFKLCQTIGRDAHDLFDQAQKSA